MAKTNRRQIVLDTETTGLNPQEGHRIIEIGCVELINRRVTKKHFHVYLNPQRQIDSGAIAVHGISNEFLATKPMFGEIVDDFIAFIRNAELVIHNAAFDVGFLNHELNLLAPTLRLGTVEDYCTVFDSLAYARKKHPGQRNSLDALCKRYNIDNSQRQLHGALLDAEILADVYLLMTGGQNSLLEDEFSSVNYNAEITPVLNSVTQNRPGLKVIPCTHEELQAHEQRLQAIHKASNACVWLKNDQ